MGCPWVMGELFGVFGIFFFFEVSKQSVCAL